MKELNTWAFVSLILVIIGGINWGLIGLFSINIITSILGFGVIGRLVFIIIGVAAGYLCYLLYLEKIKKPA